MSPWLEFTGLLIFAKKLDSSLKTMSLLTVDRRRFPLKNATSQEEELSAAFDSFNEHDSQFEATATTSNPTDESSYNSMQSRTDSPRASAVQPLRQQQLTTVDCGSNIPPPRGKTIKTLRYIISNYFFF